MTLVIKSLGATAPEGAKKLYRDALVEDGTLFHIDFSNRGTLKNFSVRNEAKVLDLARESSNPKGINTIGGVRLSADIDISLTGGKGFTLDVPEIQVLSGQGMFFEASGLMSYLSTNQPNCVWVGWARKKIDASTSQNELIRTVSGGDDTISNIRANMSTSSFIPTFGGGGLAGYMPFQKGELFQFALEFKEGQKTKLYKNKELVSEASAIATGFVPADDFGMTMIGSAYPNEAAFYRTFIEDLDVSGRTVQEILQKDWNYVHAIGEFEGITKRPFVDTY